MNSAGHSPYRRHVVVPDLLASLSGNAALQAVGVLTAVLAARLFSPADRGELAAAVASLVLVSALSDFGISQAVPYYSALRDKGVGATSIAVAASAALLLSPVLVVALKAFGPDLSAAGLAYVIIGVPLTNIVSNMGALFQGASRHVMFTTYRVLVILPYAAGLLIAGWVTKRSPDHVLWSALLLEALVCIGGVLYAKRLDVFGHASIAQARRLTSFGMRTFTGNLAFSGNRQWPVLIVEKMLGPSAAGYYSVALSYAMMPFVVASAFALLAPGRIVPKARAAGLSASRRLSRAGIAATWLLAVPLMMAAHVLLPLVYGEDYEPSIGVAVILLIASATLGTNFVHSACLRALGRPASPSVAEMVGLASTVVITPLLASRLGVTGAAWATVGSAVLVAVVLTVFVRVLHRGMS